MQILHISKLSPGNLRSGIMAFAAVSGLVPSNAWGQEADQIVLNARIYTADKEMPAAEALAIKDGMIIAVGLNSDVLKHKGAVTRVEDAAGKRILPGLVDSHIHPFGLLPSEDCSLKGKPATLREISDAVKKCIADKKIPDGSPVYVADWASMEGNAPDGNIKTLREALDRASTRHPIEIRGYEGHHFAVNSTMLAGARNAEGEIIGLTAATLKSQFVEYAKMVAVDADGEPNGRMSDKVATVLPLGGRSDKNLNAVENARELAHILNSHGITAIRDASVNKDGLDAWEKIHASGLMTYHAALAQYVTPEHYVGESGVIDYDKMVADVAAGRDRFAGLTLVRADFIKFFADGVPEGDPHAVPPTLPTSLSLTPYKQPIFGTDSEGVFGVTGYVDTDSALCEAVRKTITPNGASLAAFVKANGFHPDQCKITYGETFHNDEVMREIFRRMNFAGFTLHVHVMADGTARKVISAIEYARSRGGNASLPDGIAHAQLLDPVDIARIGKEKLYITFTYSWTDGGDAYDLMSIPFYEYVRGHDSKTLRNPSHRYDRNVFPVAAVAKAGGVIVGGSDAPVLKPDPQPFVNLSMAVTRALPGRPAFTVENAITIEQAIDSYTIDGAKGLRDDKIYGSLRTGKEANFIILDRDIIALAHDNRASEIRDAKVLKTWFRGKLVYALAGNAE